tara:strand:- start:251 stop:385 length:135 start_codon:yes stop_codon:yes gene_type:complete
MGWSDEQKRIFKVRHLCLANMWPENSEVQLLGEDGIKRAIMRIY